jgi:hypothetical protein
MWGWSIPLLPNVILVKYPGNEQPSQEIDANAKPVRQAHIIHCIRRHELLLKSQVKTINAGSNANIVERFKSLSLVNQIVLRNVL